MSSSSTAAAASTQSGRALVSIVIPNYNYGQYLRCAIDSALAQTYSPVEVIVVDDGSTDDSREVIESYGERIAPIIKANGGHGSALNAGYAASRGEIVIFLDADDELMPAAVDHVVKAWRPGVAKAQFQLEMVDESGKPLGERVPAFDNFLPNGDIRDRIQRFGEYPSSPSSGNAYSRAALERLMPMDEALWPAGSEKSLVFLTPFFGDVVSIREPLGRYRIHAANDSGFKGRHLEKLHRRLSAVYFIPETICNVAASKGIALDPGVLGSTSRELKLRMASIRLDPKTHPIAGDTRLGLLIKGIRASLREPDLSLKIRATQSAWFVLMAFGPMPVVVRLTAPAR
ncbi:MAG TPA: glycosyltransferase family 2 protein [Candidatus Acidoferrales bacterium]|nr:glycosyltransferase family 2 protein [Candidatus Acidoferrales bacterium]